MSKETQVSVEVKLDQRMEPQIETNLPFLSHMLETFACHSGIGLSVRAQGDIEVDPHHLIEDCGIVLGKAIADALGGYSGIERAASFSFPMDGSMAAVSLDLCGRRNLVWNVALLPGQIGLLDPGLFREFFKALSDSLGATIHVNLLYIDNNHHAIEAIFKAIARALREALTPVDAVLSTKGMFDQ